MERKLILRHKVLTFMKPKAVGEEKQVNDKFYLLYGFTELSESANPQEYSRKYINESYERTDVIGMTKSNSFNLDYHEGDPVHADIKNMYDKELTGTETEREFVTIETYKDVTFTLKSEMARTQKQGKKAVLRKSTIIISDMAGEEAITYAGTFNVSGDRVEGVAVTEDNWETCTFYRDDEITETPTRTIEKTE